MKRSISSKTLPFLTAVCLLLLPCATRAQRWGANRPFAVPAYGGLTNSAEPIYGGVTNGIRAGVTVLRGGGQKGVVVVSVFVTNANPGELIRLDSGTNLEFLTSFLEKVESPAWLYYMATNEFCGPVELCDVKGRKLPLLKPEVSRPDAYPARYSPSAENLNYFHRHHGYSGDGIFPVPLLGIRSSSELIRLDLAEYFDLKEPGEYRFTVWPKIYKRVPKNNDLCERIDVPPVTVTFKWP